MKREIVSYPKSGRTWLRYMMVRIGLTDEVGLTHDGFEFNDNTRPPLNFDLQARIDRYDDGAKVIYLDRDPRDVMVSLYYQVTRRFKDYFNFWGDISRFIRHDYFGAENLARFRQMWRTVCDARGFPVITYEDCHSDPRAVLEQVLTYMELPADPAVIDEVVAISTFEKMRELEASGSFPESWLQLRNGAPKVRRGLVGGFRDELNAVDIAYLDQVFGADYRIGREPRTSFAGG